jgi:hypothetical protein
VQLRLERGTERLTCFVFDHPSIRPGNRITLRGEHGAGGPWDIAAVSQPVPANAINVGWDNNI